VSAGWYIRPFREGDEKAVLRLRERVIGDLDPVRLQERTWRWQFAENPAGPAVCRLAEARGRVVGQYVVMPVRMRVEGRECTWFFSCDTMVDPDYRRRGIFTSLAGEVYAHIESVRPGAAVWGFPNMRSLPGFTGRHGWQVPAVFPVRVVLLNPVRALLRRFFRGKGGGKIPPPGSGAGISIGIPEIEFIPVERFGPEWDHVWRKNMDLASVMQARDRVYYNWRYLAEADFRYRPYYVLRKGRIEGAVILREVCMEGYRFGALVEMFPFPVVDEDVSLAVVCSVVRHFRNRGMDFATALVSRAGDDFFSRSGFRTVPERVNPRTWYFGGRFPGPAHPARTIANWYLTYGDADIV
jgi:GNAT superfamily N-acetyltransferase